MLNKKLYFAYFLFSILLFSSCSHFSIEKDQLQGFLFKNKEVKEFYKIEGTWLSSFKSKNPEISLILTELSNKEWEKTIEASKRYLRDDPFHSGVYLILATAYAGMRSFDKSSYYARLIIERNPNHVDALNILGLSYYAHAEDIESYRQAAKYFLKAHRAKHNEIAAGLNLGYLYLELGNSLASEKIFTEVRNRCLDCEDSLLGLSIAKSRLGKNKEAKKLLQEIVDSNSNNLTALYQLALYYRNFEKNKEISKNYLKRIIDSKNTEESLLTEKARLLWFENSSSQ